MSADSNLHLDESGCDVTLAVHFLGMRLAVKTIVLLATCGLLALSRPATAQTNAQTVPIDCSVVWSNDNSVTVSWPLSAYYFVLEGTTNLSDPAAWQGLGTAAPAATGFSVRSHPWNIQLVTNKVGIVGNQITANLPATNDQRFFRLEGASLVPVFRFAVFYNGLLEFSTCASMVINGPVHANGDIYTGTSSTLVFNNTVTTSGALSSPYNNGSGPWTFPGGVFNNSPSYITNVPPFQLLSSIGTNDLHFIIDMPLTNDASTDLGRQRLYNQAPVVLLVSNTTVTIRIQSAPDIGQVPGEDPAPNLLTFTNSPASLSTNLFFLTLTNKFLDQREDKTNLVTQIDVGKYATWLTTNSGVISKYPAIGVNGNPSILYVGDNRTTTAGQNTVVRLTNGIAPPNNNGIGFTLATPNPLYVWGNYNQTNFSYWATTNTSSGTVPCALICDALTILSSSWKDSTSYTINQMGPNAASSITVNAAILAGIVPSTGTNAGQFSGGINNLPRLVENWAVGNSTVWLNTSLVSLYNSTRATNKFVTPGYGSYYTAPTRHFTFDPNFADLAKLPPGTPYLKVSPSGN